MRIAVGYILTYSYIIGVLLTISLLKKKYNLKEETSRKLIHILVGLSWIIMTYFFKSSYHLIIPPLTFIIINYISYKKDIVNSMERTNKESKGTIYYAISFFILSIISTINNHFIPFYGIGVLTMTIGDGFAPFIGVNLTKYQIGKNSKTYFGSLFIMISAILISLILNNIYLLGLSTIDILLIGISATILEFIGIKGYDNLTLPLGVAVISWLLGL